MFRLDYFSCLLTVIGTILIGRRSWYGLVVAGINSALICVIGFKTAQFGFIPANLFCIVAFVFSVRSWRRCVSLTTEAEPAAPPYSNPGRPFLVPRPAPKPQQAPPVPAPSQLQGAG